MIPLLLTACGGTATPSPEVRTDTPTPAATVPVVSTDCPTASTGRAAVRPALPGTHTTANVVYVRKEGTTSSLRRYDVAAHRESEILRLDGEIYEAELSNSGEWVTFIYQPTSGNLAIQMVRVDGTLQQTLYCSPASGNNNKTLFHSTISPNQRYLAFMEGNDLSSAPIKLLDLTTGNVQVELEAAHMGATSGVPRFWLCTELRRTTTEHLPARYRAGR
jgi:hypothetical protein